MGKIIVPLKVIQSKFYTKQNYPINKLYKNLTSQTPKKASLSSD